MNDQVLDGMGLFLAAVIGLAISLILRSIDPTFGAIDDELQLRQALRMASRLAGSRSGNCRSYPNAWFKTRVKR
jgi:hypothetical protein